ncbi:MAG: amidohydrolase family protein [Spirochaetales bacterium]|nr:amidohydrolase family protein [Spirochaetales bacterium]
MKLFYQLGEKVAPGTDVGRYGIPFDTGFPITEVRLMQEAGMSAVDTIVPGTKHAAIVCGKGDSLGTPEPGKIADILVVDRNPLEDLEVLLNPYLVLKVGRLIAHTD